ncbi:MAG: VTT domain-containing protein [Casimicrobiaceae bacterium]
MAPLDTAFATLPQDRETDRAGPILAPGRNCWRIETATRAAFLVDGEEFFGAVRAALARARHSFFIVGWDVDSRMKLAPDADDGLPHELGPFLNAIVSGRKGLHGHVLAWDYAMLYALEREWWSALRLGHRARMSFRLDDRHPLGASHHQKVIAVDDEVAFVSGFDLTGSRWDTSEHACEHPLRVNSMGRRYPPFHDVGAMVEGPCARALSELCRERWRRATGRVAAPDRHGASEDSPWPPHVTAELTDVPFAIARTEPPFRQQAEVSELRALHLHAIASARRFVFAENQYFTSTIIAAAMTSRLEEPDPPEFVLVMPSAESGWLETSTMGVLRARVHAGLREADHASRYRMYCPKHACGDGDPPCINVHSKVLIVDDEFVTLGSANLANRSLCLDTECNLALEANGDPQVRRAIAGLRARLMGEHLGATAQEVLGGREQSLHATIEALRDESRRYLETIDPCVDPAVDAIVPDHEVLDPDGPFDPDILVADLLPAPRVRKHVTSRLATAVAIVSFLGALALAWRYTALNEYVTVENLLQLGERVRAAAWAPLAIIAAYVVLGLCVVPLTAMIAITAVLYNPWIAVPLSLTGALASGAATFAVGRVLTRGAVREIAGRRMSALSSRLRRRGLLAVLLVRLLPIAPYTIVNIVAGASRIRWRDFLLGTALGLFPGLVLTSAFVDRAIAAAASPDPYTLATLVLVVAAIVALALALRRRFEPRT